MTLVDLDAAADELYSLLPDDFMDRRAALVKQARGAGDRALAEEITALRKPTVTAWLANQLARHHAGEVGPLLELGEAFREATASLSGDELRALSRQRAQVVAALVRQARTLAAELGRPVNEQVGRELEQTLLAALADPEAARVLAAGRLTERLEHSGFAGPATPSRPAASSVAARKNAAAAKKAAEKGMSEEEKKLAARRDDLERELEGAWLAASAAKDAYDAATEEVRESRRRRTEAEARTVSLREELEAAETELEGAEADAEAAVEESARTEAELKEARATVSQLQRQLDRLVAGRR